MAESNAPDFVLEAIALTALWRRDCREIRWKDTSVVWEGASDNLVYKMAIDAEEEGFKIYWREV